MSDLISRSALIEYMCGHCGASCNLEDECCANVDAVENAPAVDAVEVVHGRWERYVCVACGFDLRWLTDGENDLEQWVWDEGFDYCPNCGAKMDGGEDDD